MIDTKDTNIVIDSLRRCCHSGSYAGTPPGETCNDCAYYGKCCDLELDTAGLILLLDDLTGHQFMVNRDAIIDLRNCNRCSADEYFYMCRAHNMYGSSGCDKLHDYAADILERMYSRYIAGHAFKTKCLNRPFFVRSPGGTWEPINEDIEPLVDTYLDSIMCDGFRGGKIYDVKTIHKEDMVDAMAYSNLLVDAMKSAFERNQKEEFRKRYEYPLTPKSIEQSVDHKTVCVLWQDGSKTIVKLSDNDKDDINTAFAYALAKKIFGSNTHLKKVVASKVNEHKSKTKKQEDN